MEGTIIGSTDHVFPSPPGIVHGLASQTMIRYHFRLDKLFGREACTYDTTDCYECGVGVQCILWSQTIALKNSVPVPSAGQCTDCVDSIIILILSSLGSMKYSNTFITLLII